MPTTCAQIVCPTRFVQLLHLYILLYCTELIQNNRPTRSTLSRVQNACYTKYLQEPYILSLQGVRYVPFVYRVLFLL